MTSTALARRLLAELVGTAALVAVVVGSGIAAQKLSPNQTGLQLLENSTTTAFGLGVLIVLFGPVSGAHLNPVGAGLWLGEVVATAGLVAAIFALARTGRASLSAVTVAAYIGAAYWFTSSTSFANPAITVGRMFSDSFAGIAPASAPGFIVAHVLGAVLGAGLVLVLYPDAGRAADVVVTAPSPGPADERARSVQ